MDFKKFLETDTFFFVLEIVELIVLNVIKFKLKNFIKKIALSILKQLLKNS